MPMSRTPRIDADVHVQAPLIRKLHPYLTEHWRDYLTENGFQRPSAVAQGYPPTSAVMAKAPAESTLEDLRDRVLGSADQAIVSCYYGVEGVRHPFMAAALATAVNSWLREEWLEREPRLFGSLVIPSYDTELAVQEVKRAGGDRRFVQIALPARSWEPYGNRRYWPIYEAAIERDLAIGIHFGGLAGNPPTPVGALDSYFEEYAAATQLFASHVLSLLAEGVFDRYPDLRVALVESGVSWLPTWLWKLDTEWKATRREIPWVRELPSAYVRRHFALTIQPLDAPLGQPSDLREVIGHLGSDDMLMFSSDYPHQHASDTDQLLGLLDPAQLEKVLHTNASRFFRLADRAAIAGRV